MDTAASFYDALAPDYHLLFDDWWSAAQWDGGVIADLLAARGIAGGHLLDCTCGVGTQALPLAALGYHAIGTDVSAAQRLLPADPHRKALIRRRRPGAAYRVRRHTPAHAAS
jgi:glycine/sarcosine N-methyltransferase